MPKKPDRSTAPPVPLRVGHVADAARDDHGVPAVRDDWGDQRSVARVREATEAIANIARELTANSTLNFEVLAALDLLEMTCTAAVALAFEMPTPTPNPLARRVAAAKVALRGSMANKGVLQLAVVEFLEQLTDPENDSEGRFQFDMGGERQRRTLEYDGLPAEQHAALAKASSAAQALVASVRPPSPERMFKALMNLHPARGSHGGDQSGPSEEKKWDAMNSLLMEMGIGSTNGPGLARSVRAHRSETGSGS